MNMANSFASVFKSGERHAEIISGPVVPHGDMLRRRLGMNAPPFLEVGAHMVNGASVLVRIAGGPSPEVRRIVGLGLQHDPDVRQGADLIADRVRKVNVHH
jgi:hypothetical protein